MSNLPKSLQDPMAVMRRGKEIMDDIIERRLVIAIQRADRDFEKAGATGTKNYVRGYLLPAMKWQGLKIDTEE